MKISTLFKLAQTGLFAVTLLFATSYATPDAVAQGKKPSFAGKPSERLGKGGRSEDAKHYGQSKKEELEEKAKKAKKAKKPKRAKKR